MIAMKEEGAEGGCLCGAIRFRTTGRPIWLSYCHCRDCRKASGAPITAFVGFRKDQVDTLKGTAQVYDSSPGIQRRFCNRCGTPLSYDDARLEGEIYIMVGTFDEPERFKPERHAWVTQRLPWLHIRDDLPRHQQNSKPRP